jgi:hypothetical protein
MGSLWVLSLFSLCLFSHLLSCEATNYTWAGATSGGSWSDSANWSPAGIPGASDTATFDYSSCYGVCCDVVHFILFYFIYFLFFIYTCLSYLRCVLVLIMFVCLFFCFFLVLCLLLAG